MIRDAKIAKLALKFLRRAKVPLEESLSLVHENCSAAEYDEYAKAMSHVQGADLVSIGEPDLLSTSVHGTSRISGIVHKGMGRYSRQYC